ncbi:Bcr/CflA family multidrug efflux MFS transporter [Allopusillimonas soli]|uniref:Bcr/CflA family efflux transporter n=2 Tax=Allopusillimonas soli TaxID=659016 RepID=A0A853F722_9BURK|nr:Bcr/CflA family multidrug efflux MFS transporter [Allopusillimonas soli]NYT35618.1 Bcr/CflA family multidrug efflux MFS transporter [Allopusillimonas soli]TEA76729.1 Bcr/CflA family multidrug efflux MFS transporter [Allopusillimonas soli]
MGLLTALGPLAIDMYLPAFPAIVEGLGTTQGDVERTLASYLLGLACAQIFYGPLADRFGRKPPLLLGLAIYTAAAIGCCLSASIEQLSFWRIVQAFGGAAGIVIPRAVIRDNFDTRDASKALSILLLVMGVTPILAPLLGGQVLAFGSWRGIFAIMAAGSGAMLFAVIFTMRETLTPERVVPLRIKTIKDNYLALARHKQFLCYTLAGGMGSAGMFAYISGSPRVFIDVMGVDPRYFGFVFGANAAALIFASQVSARMLSRHSPETLLRTAQITLVLMTLAGVVLSLAGAINLTLLMICLIGFMASQGFVNPNAAALALAKQGHRLGVASAMMGALQMLCGAAAGLAVSAWQAHTALPLTAILAVCATLSWLFGRIALRAA